MKKYAFASALIIAFVTPALALEEGPYYVGLNTTTHTCSVVTKMESGMKQMGKLQARMMKKQGRRR